MLSILRADLNSAEQHRLVRSIRRIFCGAAAGVPSPSILRFEDVGLLYFFSQKQAKFHAAIANVDVEAHETLLPVKNLVTFVTTVVGWLIVEAERVDEAIIAVKKDINLTANGLRDADLDLQYQHARTGTEVMQAIAEHHKSRVNVPQRTKNASIEQFDSKKSGALAELPVRIVQLRQQLRMHKAHLHVLQVARRLLHGARTAEVPQVEADAIVMDLSALTTVRKAAHRVRDAVFDVPGRESLDAIASVLEVFAYIDRGLTAALDDLEHAQIQLKKAVLTSEKQSDIEQLDLLDARNKQLSTAALRQNEEIGHDVGRFPVSSASPSYATPRATHNTSQMTELRSGGASRKGLAALQQRTPARGKQQFLSPATAVGATPLQLRRANVTPQMASPVPVVDPDRGLSVQSHLSEMDEFLQHYCS